MKDKLKELFENRIKTDIQNINEKTSGHATSFGFSFFACWS